MRARFAHKICPNGIKFAHKIFLDVPSCVEEASFCGIMASFQVLSYAGERSFHTHGRSSFMRKRMILQQQQGGFGRGRLDQAAHEARL